MGAKESVEAAAKINADGWGHAEVMLIFRLQRPNTSGTCVMILSFFINNLRPETYIQPVIISIPWSSGQTGGCASCAMGNKLSCSCAPLIRKGYRYEDSPWQSSRRRDGHLLRFSSKLENILSHMRQIDEYGIDCTISAKGTEENCFRLKVKQNLLVSIFVLFLETFNDASFYNERQWLQQYLCIANDTTYTTHEPHYNNINDNNNNNNNNNNNHIKKRQNNTK
uniref:Uncharacterized protein n=1 Tax=Glossina pallidipes TaxID=7398 RepID=A0A1A9Z977_GLOPL